MSSVETPVSVSVSIEEPEPEPVVYTLIDGFGEEANFISSAEDYFTYLDAHKGATIRTTVTKMTCADVSSAEENSDVVDEKEYVTYIDSSVDLSDNDVRSCTRVSTFGNDGQVKPQDAYGITDDEFDAFNSASISEIYKTVLKSASLDGHFDNMFVTGDTEVTEEEVNVIKETKAYRVVAGTPSDAVFATVLPNDEYSEITLGDMSCDLTETDGLVLPSCVTANVQYTDKDGVVTTYTVSVVVVSYDDTETFSDMLTCRGDGCACGYVEPKKEVKAEAKPVASSSNTAPWGGEIVWEGGVAGLPYSVGEYLIESLYDDGTTISLYETGKPNDGSVHLGQIQLEAEEIIKQRTGCDSVHWHTEYIYDYPKRADKIYYLMRWYTEAVWY